MSTITAAELRRNLKQVLERVQAGEEIIVTCRGRVMGRLVPVRYADRRMEGLDALLALKEHLRVESADEGAFSDAYAAHLEEKYGTRLR